MRFIGSKTDLLKDIEKLLTIIFSEMSKFLDLFAGTNVVGDYFKKIILSYLMIFIF